MRTARTLLLAATFSAGLLATTGANAALTTIGQATYHLGTNNNSYNLIWDDNNNGNSVVWLDYAYLSAATWTGATKWATGLNATGVLSYTFNDGYSVDWGANSWRLPTTVDGTKVVGNDGTTTAGYNITTSEMGHLFYTELGNKGYRNADGTYNTGSTAPNYLLTNVGEFQQLKSKEYWSSESPNAPFYNLAAWYFAMGSGLQNITASNKSDPKSGLAIRTGQVTYSDPTGGAPVPVPAAAWLLGSGLLGLVGVARRKAA